MDKLKKKKLNSDVEKKKIKCRRGRRKGGLRKVTIKKT